MRFFYRLAWTVVRIYTTLFCKLKLVGVDNIPMSKGIVVASNHISWLDPPILASSINRPMFFMAKKELFSIPVVGRLITALNSIPIKRGVFDRGALAKSIDVLKEGYGLISFPEGTRSRTGELGPGKPGVGMLARKAEVAVLPIYLKNSKIFYKVIFSRKRLEIWFGEPLSAEWISSLPESKDSYRLIVSELMKKIIDLKVKAEGENN